MTGSSALAWMLTDDHALEPDQCDRRLTRARVFGGRPVARGLAPVLANQRQEGSSHSASGVRFMTIPRFLVIYVHLAGAVTVSNDATAG